MFNKDNSHFIEIMGNYDVVPVFGEKFPNVFPCMLIILVLLNLCNFYKRIYNYLIDSKTYFIDSIIVPLYPKIYLEAVVAKELFLQIIKDDKVGYDFSNNFVFRYFLASSRSFKNHVSKLDKIDKELKVSILSLKMPKFVWCSEFYTKEGYTSADKIALGVVILDATEANRESIDALIFAGYPDRCISMIENNFASLRHKLEYYTYFSNLK